MLLKGAVSCHGCACEELFSAHDLNKNGMLEEIGHMAMLTFGEELELIQLNKKIVLPAFFMFFSPVLQVAPGQKR